MLGEILKGLFDLTQWAITTAAEAAVAREEEHAAILARVEATRKARMGERAEAHAETDKVLAEAQAELDRLKAENEKTRAELDAVKAREPKP